jgi:hypothetical protein
MWLSSRRVLTYFVRRVATEPAQSLKVRSGEQASRKEEQEIRAGKKTKVAE